jgi:hypothetical protein
MKPTNGETARASVPVAQLVHATTHRARLRFETAQPEAAFLTVVRHRLESLPSVEAVEVRPSTGSVIVWHTGPFAAIAGHARRAHWFRVSAPAAARAGDGSPVTVFSTQVARWLGDRDRALSAAGAVVLAGMSAWQVRQGHLLPPALTLARWAGSMLRNVAQPGVVQATAPMASAFDDED